MRKRTALLTVFVLLICCMCFFAIACGGKTNGGHSLERVAAKDATCEEDGNIEYWRCTDDGCGKLFSDANGNTETALADVTVTKLGHTGGEATCTEKAVCTRCGNEYGEFAPHTLQGNWLTCEEGHYKKCGVCQGYSDPMAHAAVTVIRGEDPTCTDTGLSAQIECDICGYVVQAQDELPAKGHSGVHREVRAATCEDDGYKVEHWYCADCDSYFSDAACESAISESAAVEDAIGHDYGAWVSNGDDTHTRTCGNDSSHTQNASCSGGTATCLAKATCTDCGSAHGDLAPHTGGEFVADATDASSGHREHCSVCHAQMNATLLPHGLTYDYGDNDHWQECVCGYETAHVAHVPASIVASLKPEVAATIYAGQVLTEQDITVVASCACGNIYTLESGYTIESKALIEGNNLLEVTLNGSSVKTSVNADASDAPAHTLTLVGATFAGGNTTLSVKAGGGISGVLTTAGKTFYGFKDAQQNFYTVNGFVMPDDDLTISALYKEDMLHYAPSDHHNNWKPSTNTAVHKEYNGVMGTEITFKPDSDNPVFFANSASDSKTADVNVYAPVCGKTLMILTVINDNDDEYEITYAAENNGNYGQVLALTLAPHSTTVVPINYWTNNSSSFAGCDHQVTMVSTISDEVKLGFYGYIAVDGKMAVNTLNVSGIDTWYADGDTFDLSEMKVQANVSEGHFMVNVYDYTVSVADGSAWNSNITEITVTACGYVQTIKLNDLTDWMAFTFSHDAGATGSMSKEAVIVDGIDGARLEATKVTVGAGATAGSKLEFHTHTDNNATKTQNYNVRVPVEGSRSLIYVVTNTGSTDLTLWLGNDTGSQGTEVTVHAGEVNKLVTLTMTGNTVGGWMKIGLAADAPDGGEVVVYGYFKTNEGEFSSISVRGESQHKTSYNVGETLDTSNLVIKPTPSNSSQANNGDYTLNLTNYKTEIVGHTDSKTFTPADAGQTFTVKVYWNGFETSYSVTVAA